MVLGHSRLLAVGLQSRQEGETRPLRERYQPCHRVATKVYEEGLEARRARRGRNKVRGWGLCHRCGEAWTGRRMVTRFTERSFRLFLLLRIRSPTTALTGKSMGSQQYRKQLLGLVFVRRSMVLYGRSILTVSSTAVCDLSAPNLNFNLENSNQSPLPQLLTLNPCHPHP